MNDWCERMAAELAKLEGNITADIIKASLEAAGELRCVRLKILLARCLEVIQHSRSADTTANCNDEFEAEVEAELVK